MDSIPNSWTSDKVTSLINEESLKLKPLREAVLERFNFKGNKIVEVDLNCISIPEILSAQFCKLSGNEDLLCFSSPLQAFMTYSLSLYDLISDNHFYKKGKPTFLGTYGLEYVKLAEEKYKLIFQRLAEDLEMNGVSNAVDIANRQYSETIIADRIRNARILSSKEAISLQERIAGLPASRIALLSNADGDLEQFSFYLVNAMTTLEDLVDLFHGEDFICIKTTIPISFLVEEFGKIIEDYPLIVGSLAIQQTKRYIQAQLRSAKSLFNFKAHGQGNLLLNLIDDMSEFINRFPEGYIQCFH